jgi:hypothetical protein
VSGDVTNDQAPRARSRPRRFSDQTPAAIRRDEAAARHAENKRYANAIRRIAGQRASQYQPRVIEHNGAWAVALGEGEVMEIIEDNLTSKQAQRFVRRAGCFVRGENVRRKRM